MVISSFLCYPVVRLHCACVLCWTHSIQYNNCNLGLQKFSWLQLWSSCSLRECAVHDFQKKNKLQRTKQFSTMASKIAFLKPNIAPTGTMKSVTKPNIAPSGTMKSVTKPSIAPTGTMKSVTATFIFWWNDTHSTSLYLCTMGTFNSAKLYLIEFGLGWIQTNSTWPELNIFPGFVNNFNLLSQCSAVVT